MIFSRRELLGRRTESVMSKKRKIWERKWSCGRIGTSSSKPTIRLSGVELTVERWNCRLVSASVEVVLWIRSDGASQSAPLALSAPLPPPNTSYSSPSPAILAASKASQSAATKSNCASLSAASSSSNSAVSAVSNAPSASLPHRPPRQHHSTAPHWPTHPRRQKRPDVRRERAWRTWHVLIGFGVIMKA